MGKLDKDRYLKELAVRFCLARGMLPFMEVVVPSASDLSDAAEVLTDVDVLGISQRGDGSITRTVFDCKSSSKLSGINRAFWAAGLRDYIGADDAFVITNNKATQNHRLSALKMSVDVHDEQSFIELGRSIRSSFPQEYAYQAAIENWDRLEDCYKKNPWAKLLQELCATKVPLTFEPWGEFRKIISALRAVKGHFDPDRTDHMSIYFDVLSSSLFLWVTVARDMRRYYHSKLTRGDFETALRYYIWGGKESYGVRQQLMQQTSAENKELNLPAWPKFVQFAGLTLDSPYSMLECSFVSKELSLRVAATTNAELDAVLTHRLDGNDRIVQFVSGLNDYLVAASALPSDLRARAEETLFDLS